MRTGQLLGLTDFVAAVAAEVAGVVETCAGLLFGWPYLH